MDIKTARNHYSSVINNINHNDKFDQPIDYFERTWLNIDSNNNKTKFDYDIWNYYGKFDFENSRKSII